ncbi:UAA transporter, partial [Cylindrobasidium torrendii FP15055 ss-10]
MASMLATLGLVFGGCCSNALSLEHLTADYPDSAALLTFAQFSIISLNGLRRHLIWTSRGPRLKPTQIPLRKYALQVLLFYALSFLNNYAFAFKIPMAVHIIFRSGGLIVSLIMGWLIAGKRYSVHHVLSVVVVTLGVIFTTLSASPSSDLTASAIPTSVYYTGIGLLSVALILSGLLGIVQDATYAQHKGSSPWEESMFYLHFLAMPMFAFMGEKILYQAQSLHSSASFQSNIPVPSAYLLLLANVTTQLVCVAGVNRLTTQVNSLTVTLILVVRKAVSLLVSVLLKGTAEHVDVTMLWAGAGLVLLGTVWYSYGSARAKTKEKGKKKD